jgi:hypothetical protein
MLAILGAVVEAIAFVGEIVGLVQFAAKLRRWWDGEARTGFR